MPYPRITPHESTPIFNEGHTSPFEDGYTSNQHRRRSPTVYRKSLNQSNSFCLKALLSPSFIKQNLRIYVCQLYGKFTNRFLFSFKKRRKTAECFLANFCSYIEFTGVQVVRISSQEGERRQAVAHHHRRLPIIENVAARTPMLKSTGRIFGDAAVTSSRDYQAYNSPRNNPSLDYYSPHNIVRSPSPTPSLEIPVYRPVVFNQSRSRFHRQLRSPGPEVSNYRESPCPYYSSGSAAEANHRQKHVRPQPRSCHVLVSDSDNEDDSKWSVA